MIYKINKPNSELTEGYLILVLKYITIFVILWVIAWVFLAFSLASSANDTSDNTLMNLVIENTAIVSTLIAGLIIAYLVYQNVNKYKLGLITSFNFLEDELELELLNTFNGVSKVKKINKSALKIKLESADSHLIGKQKIINFYENEISVSRLNIQTTAWVRHPEINNLIGKLQELS